MEIDTKNSSGMLNGLPPTSKESKRVGPIVGALVVVLLIIVVILYFFGQRLNTQNAIPEVSPVVNVPANTQASVASQSSPVSPEADIQSMQDSLDSQLKDVDYSF